MTLRTTGSPGLARITERASLDLVGGHASLQLPAQMQAIAHFVFTHAFVDAMRPTMVLPIVVLVLAALAAVFVRGHKAAELSVHDAEAAVA